MVHLAVTIRRDGLFLHPGKIAFSLFRRHGAADVVEVLQHLLLTVSAEQGGFRQRLLDVRRDSIGGSQ